MAEMHAVFQSLAEGLGHLARIDIDLTEISEEFDRSEPFLEGEGDSIRDIRGGLRLAARALRNKTSEYAAMADARAYADSSDVLGAPPVVDQQVSPAPGVQ
jgi:hypothetical protein